MGDVRWWLLYALGWALLYGAFVLNLDGALYVLKFCIWFMAVLAPLLLTEAAIAKSVEEPPMPLRSVMGQLRSWAALALLVWFGHIATGAALGVVMLFGDAHGRAVRRKRAQGGGDG